DAGAERPDDVGIDARRVLERDGEIRVVRDDLAAGSLEGIAEGLDDAAAVLVIGVEDDGPACAEPFVCPACEGGPVQQVAGADAEDPGSGVGDERAAGCGRDGDEAALVIVVEIGRGKGRVGVDVPDNRDDARVVTQLHGDLDGALRVRLVVAGDELDAAAEEAALLVDLFDGELGCEAHGAACDLAEGSGERDADGAAVRGAAAGEECWCEGEGNGGDPDPVQGVHHRIPLTHGSVRTQSCEALRGAARWRSKSARMRRYSSVHELGSTKPWFSTG